MKKEIAIMEKMSAFFTSQKLQKNYNAVFVILVLSVILIFASGCSQQTTDTTKSGTCGDGICSSAETCNCADCVGDTKCSGAAATCDDGQACTVDTYNPSTAKCEHTSDTVCCGDTRCDESERCDMATYQTICQKDCGLRCPEKIIMHKEGNIDQLMPAVTCEGQCLEIAPNKYQVTGPVKLTTIIENIGERASNSISSSTYCTFGGSTKNTDGLLGGVDLKFYFDNGESTLSALNGRTSEGHMSKYTIELDPSALTETKTMTCQVNVDTTGFEQTAEQVDLTFMTQ